jgi:type IV secretory pathway VirJ component
MRRLLSGLFSALALTLAAVAPASASTGDFSQVASPAPGGNQDAFVIFYSGNGGWAGIDKAVGGRLAQAGLPVVGVDSLRYFMTRRSAEAAAADLAAAIDRYSVAFGRRKVVLAGYSFGGEALPLIVERLPAAERAKVEMLALISVGDQGELAFHAKSWLNLYSADAQPLRPALAALKGLPTLCLHGGLELQSGCVHMADLVSETVVIPGGHHYDGHYDQIAQAIATRIPR